MKKSHLMGIAMALLLSGCGNDSGQGAATEPPAATPVPAETPAAPPAAPGAGAGQALPPVAAASDTELTYDPIDITKLDNSWYKQFSGGE